MCSFKSKIISDKDNDFGDIMIMAGKQVGIWGNSIRFHIPAKD